MKILIIMDPGILIPVSGYGGIERIIEMLAKEYKNLGHDVDLLITQGSLIKGCNVHGYGEAVFPPTKKGALKAIFTVWKFLWKNKNRYDFIHNFGRLIYLLPVLNSAVQKVMSYQREITTRNIIYIHKLPHKNLQFTGCSNDLITRANVNGKWTCVYNCCDFDKYNVTKIVDVDAPLIFLGRIERIKGCHSAIAIAKATNNILIIAGNISVLQEEIEYFEKDIKPNIDGKQIKYLGEVNDTQKNEWLGKAKALLIPIEWNEPFGIVMIEAMACGTPVIAYNKGSINEVVKDFVSGFKCLNIEEMIHNVSLITSLKRPDIREYAYKNFNVKKISQQYLSLLH